MEKIMLYKNGVITKNDGKETLSVLKLLGNYVDISKDFTLYSFFMMIKKYPDLKNISEMLVPLLEIVSKFGISEFKTKELESLLFYKIIEIKGFPGTPSLNFYTTLKGVSDKKMIDLKFFHLEDLLNHKLKLGELEHIVFGDKEDVFRYNTFYTLFEMIEGIAWQLSFNFNPLQCSIRR